MMFELMSDAAQQQTVKGLFKLTNKNGVKTSSIYNHGKFVPYLMQSNPLYCPL